MNNADVSMMMLVIHTRAAAQRTSTNEVAFSFSVSSSLPPEFHSKTVSKSTESLAQPELASKPVVANRFCGS